MAGDMCHWMDKRKQILSPQKINVEYLHRKLKCEMTDWLHHKVFCNVNFLTKCLEPELNKKRFSYLLHEYVGFLLRPNFAFNSNELTIALMLFLYEASPCNKVVLQIANSIVNVHLYLPLLPIFVLLSQMIFKNLMHARMH